MNDFCLFFEPIKITPEQNFIEIVGADFEK